MMLYPPKPNAIATILTTEGSALLSPITHIQTLIFSIHKSLQKYQSVKYRKENLFYYPPEILIVVAVGNEYEEDIIRSIRKSLAVFCFRIIRVDPIIKSIMKLNHDFSGLHLFDQQSYNSILYINQNCLIINDISNIFEMMKNDSNDEIVAAALHPTETNKFGSTFMLLRPSNLCFQDMMKSMTIYIEKGDDFSSFEDFLNVYKQTPMTKKFVIESYTQEKANNDHSNEIIPIYHFSFTPKPWEENAKKYEVNLNACHLWDSFYKNGQSYIEERRQRQKDKLHSDQKKKMKINKSTSITKNKNSQPNENKGNHKSIAAQYKLLRKQGLSAKDAMVQARAAIGDVEKEDNPGASVAAMFGLK